jgi:hypothetical protein
MSDCLTLQEQDSIESLPAPSLSKTSKSKSITTTTNYNEFVVNNGIVKPKRQKF